MAGLCMRHLRGRVCGDEYRGGGLVSLSEWAAPVGLYAGGGRERHGLGVGDEAYPT